MGVCDGTTGGNRFWGGVNKVIVKQVPTALTVEVQDENGSVTKSVELTQAQLESLVSDSSDVALGQYYKSNQWTVYRSTNYVTYADLFSYAGVTVGANDTISVAASDGAGKWSGSLSTMQSGKWYPNADGTTLGDAAEGYLPAGLALSATSGKGATVTEALSAASAEGASEVSNTPLVLMGVCDGTTGGNRFWSGVNKVIVKQVPTALTVEVQDDSGNVVNTVELTQAQLESLVSDSSDVALGQYYKSGSWTVYRSTNYVTYADLFDYAGVTVGANDIISVAAADGSGKWSGSLSTMQSGKWYPDADGTTLGNASEGNLPAGLALSATSGKGSTVTEALNAASAEGASEVSNTPLVLMGVCDGTTGGNRFWSGVNKVIVKQVPVLTED
jgi:hypothetical protein